MVRRSAAIAQMAARQACAPASRAWASSCSGEQAAGDGVQRRPVSVSSTPRPRRSNRRDAVGLLERPHLARQVGLADAECGRPRRTSPLGDEMEGAELGGVHIGETYTCTYEIIYWTYRSASRPSDAMAAPNLAASETGDPLLLTPGPLTTSATRQAGDGARLGLARRGLHRASTRGAGPLVELAGAEGTHVTVPLQGSGTFAVEAMITTFVPRDGKLLVLVNGAYGQRAKKIAGSRGRAVVVHETPEDTPPDLAAARRAARGRPGDHPCRRRPLRDDLRHPQPDRRDRGAGRAAWPPPADRCHERLWRAAARCAAGAVRRARRLLEQVPRGRAGPRLRVCRKTALAACKGNATSLILDLHDQCEGLERTGQWRFTPPTHVIAALASRRSRSMPPRAASPGRGRRYRDNCKSWSTACARWASRPCCRMTAGADHRHLPHAADPAFRLPGASTTG